MAIDTQIPRGFQFYATGIVSRDKEEGTDYIYVVAMEDFSQEKGTLTDAKRSFESKLPDSKGVKKTTKVEGSAEIYAQWLALSNPNRDNSPDVYAGETVELYRYGDTQDYYWTTLLREPSLRRLERGRYVFSNKREKDGSKYDKDSSYWIEFDTKNKFIKLHTSSNDGEVTDYDFFLDTKNGTFEVKDQLGNSIYLESQTGKLSFATLTEVNIETQQVNIKAEVFINGNTTTTGNVDVGGGLTSSGPMHAASDITSDGSIMDSTGNSNHHSH